MNEESNLDEDIYLGAIIEDIRGEHAEEFKARVINKLEKLKCDPVLKKRFSQGYHFKILFEEQ